MMRAADVPIIRRGLHLRRLFSARWLWPALAVLVACVPFAGGFSATNIFYIRDLTMFFWPRHLWIHRSLVSGSWPLWDPYAAAGQSASSDAMNQLFLPPVLLLRALPSVPGFNLLVAAPFPLAALGMWLLLRRHLSATSAALGAIVFSASGPVVSTGNFPNLSWSVAWIPWIVWAADRDGAAPSARGFALVTTMIAFQMLSGEPVTMVGTLALLVGYIVVCAEETPPLDARVRAVARLVAAMAVATAIAAVQLVPMALAASASQRSLMRTDNFWSVHPLWLVESVLPHLFGDTFRRYNSELPWITPLNSGRDPFFYSLGLSLAALLLSFLGTLCGPRRRRFFWLSVAIAGVVLACGEHTPVYPMLQWVLPPLRSLRYPAKFLVFASLGLAALAASGADALQQRDMARGSSAVPPGAFKATCGVALAAALALVILISLVVVAPFTGARTFYDLGVSVGVADPVAGAAYLFSAVPPIATRALIFLATSALLVYLGWAGGHAGRLARMLLLGLATVELLVASAGLNPVLPASRLGPPAWASALAAHPAERFYFGGKFRGGGILAPNDVDLRGIQWQTPHGVTVEEGRTLLMANLAMAPAGWEVRELISYDLPQLWPIAQDRAAARFERADRAERLRFLARGGVRYCLLASPPHPGAAALQRVGDQFGAMAVYECVPDARRASVVATASVVPDLTMQLERLFEASFDAGSTVMLERPAPDAAGTPGAWSAASAQITTDADQEVAIAAAAGAEGGYLVLEDSFDRGWHVEVDGRPAALLRANALYRAVHISPGPHTVRFTYRPTVFYVCLIFSTIVALALAVTAIRRPHVEHRVTPRHQDV
jgi:membrane protein YfhO